MKRAIWTLLVLLATVSAARVSAQSVATTARGQIVVAHDGGVELFTSDGKQRLWWREGVTYPGAIVVGDTSVAVVDPVSNLVAIFDLASGTRRLATTAETPIDGVYHDGCFYVIARDARTIERIRPDGSETALLLPMPDPAFVRVSNQHIYVYSRLSGSIQEITTSPFALGRNLAAAPFASDFEIDGVTAYTVHPRDALIRIVDLETGKADEQIRVGAVPMDVSFAAGATPLTATMLAVADPSSKRVWLIEGKQSPAQAFARGFLRGLIGLGLFRGKQAAFATGVDRVIVREPAFIAFDSSSGTLFRLSKKKIEVLARGIGPSAFAVTPERIVWWQNGTLVAQKTNG